jgi:hypothetical protein
MITYRLGNTKSWLKGEPTYISLTEAHRHQTGNIFYIYKDNELVLSIPIQLIHVPTGLRYKQALITELHRIACQHVGPMPLI